MGSRCLVPDLFERPQELFAIAMKILLLLVAAILAVANAKPWLHIEFELPSAARDEFEEPIKPDSKDCSVYYNRNYPMQCAPGLLFHPVSLTCELEEVVKVERTDISC